MGCWNEFLGIFERRNIARVDILVMIWCIVDGLEHMFLEGPYLIISLIGTVNTSTSAIAIPWREYGKADSRWLVSDPMISGVEFIVVFFVGPLCILEVYAIWTHRTYRHWLQMVINVCDLYGDWMCLVPEFLIGSPHLNYANPLYLWVYLIFFYALWIIIPLLLVYQSWIFITRCARNNDNTPCNLERSQCGKYSAVEATACSGYPAVFQRP